MKLKLWFKNVQQTNVQDQMTSQVNSIKLLRVKTDLSETILKNYRGRNTPKLILWGSNSERYHKKRTLQVNITDEHRHKNHQQNTTKPNPAIY